MKKTLLVSSPRFWSLARGYKLHDMSIAYMSLNQDSMCNANCRGCFRYPERKSGLTGLLKVSDYERLLDEFRRFGGLAIEISGEGESLLRDTCTLPIIRHASSFGIWTTLITNGHALRQELINELCGLRVALVISLHSLKQEKYEYDNGCPGSFKSVMEAIENVSKVFRDEQWIENGYVIRRACIHWTLQADNLDETSEVKKFCRERGLHFSIAPLANVGHAPGHPEIHLPREYANLEAINGLGDESIIFYDEPDGRLVCGTCKYGLNIGADGNLLLDAHGGYEVEIANIRDISFKRAVELQHKFSTKMFSQLSSFCPVRDPGWGDFLLNKRYL